MSAFNNTNERRIWAAAFVCSLQTQAEMRGKHGQAYKSSVTRAVEAGWGAVIDAREAFGAVRSSFGEDCDVYKMLAEMVGAEE